jgi:hypothetical protein
MQPACHRSPLPILPAILLIILPKCPLCLGAWFGIFGAIGARSWIAGAWGTPLGAALLSVTVCALAVRAFRTRDPRPVALGLPGAIAVLAGKHFTDIFSLCAGGCLLVLATALQSASGQKTCCPKSSSEKHDTHLLHSAPAWRKLRSASICSNSASASPAGAALPALGRTQAQT